MVDTTSCNLMNISMDSVELLVTGKKRQNGSMKNLKQRWLQYTGSMMEGEFGPGECLAILQTCDLK
jgi:hypothetical protein